MTPAERLLTRLTSVRQTGPGRWMARCPAHDDRSPSLSIRQGGDGRVLIHCFAGCPVEDVVAAIELDLADLFPKRLRHTSGRPARPAPRRDDVLGALPGTLTETRALLTTLVNEGTFDKAAVITVISRLDRYCQLLEEAV